MNAKEKRIKKVAAKIENLFKAVNNWEHPQSRWEAETEEEEEA